MEHSTQAAANPLLTMWTQPRATVRRLVETTPERFVLVLAALAGIVQVLDRASFSSTGDTVSFRVILGMAFLLGPLFGIAALYLGGILIAWTGKWIGGTASSRQVRTAVAWANLPVVTGLALWVPALVVFGAELFTTATPRLMASVGLSLALVAFGLASLTLGVWSFVLLLKGVGEVQGFSAWKALGNLLLGGLVLVVPIVMLAILAAIVIPMAAS